MFSKQKSLNFGHYVSNDKVLNKKVPENPKYKHVKPAIDTGKNVRKHIDELKEKQKNCNHKKDEVFKRIKFSAFLKLILACAAEFNSYESDVVGEPSSPNMPEASKLAGRQCTANVLMGIGELDAISNQKKFHSAPIKLERQLPYLLLDVRDRDAFSQCHIITAKSYPSAMLSRSLGYENEDLKTYKNSKGIIILYDDDESIAIRVATTLVERGYENVFLLTGGLKLALEVCPHSLTTSSQMLTPVHILTHGATSYAQKNVEKQYFSQEDIATIQHYIDNYPNRGNNLPSSISSSQSRNGSVRCGHRHCVESSACMSRTSTSSQRDSSCNSSIMQQRHQSVSSKNSKPSQAHSHSTKSIEKTHSKPKCTIDEKNLKPKRAPWK